jgi:hypothetical protein
MFLEINKDSNGSWVSSFKALCMPILRAINEDYNGVWASLPKSCSIEFLTEIMRVPMQFGLAPPPHFRLNF